MKKLSKAAQLAELLSKHRTITLQTLKDEIWHTWIQNIFDLKLKGFKFDIYTVQNVYIYNCIYIPKYKIINWRLRVLKDNKTEKKEVTQENRFITFLKKLFRI